MCASPRQGQALPASIDLEKETVLTGRVLGSDGSPVPGAFVRLLDGTDEFTAEVVTSANGDYRFFAAPGTWTLRAISRNGSATLEVRPAAAGIHQNDLTVSA